VEIDNKRAAEVIHLHMPASIPDFVSSLSQHKETQYLFLQGLFSIK